MLVETSALVHRIDEDDVDELEFVCLMPFHFIEFSEKKEQVVSVMMVDLVN